MAMFHFKIQRSTKQVSAAGITACNRWHAVRVFPAPRACAAVEEIRHKRYLSDEAPRLPLADCSSAWRCKCTYKHFQDRRMGPRRAAERDELIRPRTGPENRRLVG